MLSKIGITEVSSGISLVVGGIMARYGLYAVLLSLCGKLITSALSNFAALTYVYSTF
jgi:hypothetical protein